MPLSGLIKLGLSRPTPQQIADFALAEDQAARRARQRGDRVAARAHDAESAALLALMPEAN